MEEILAQDISDVDKLRAMFEHITDQILIHEERQLELVRAMNDREEIVKSQIKIEMVKHTRSILQTCYQQMMHKKQAV